MFVFITDFAVCTEDHSQACGRHCHCFVMIYNPNVPALKKSSCYFKSLQTKKVPRNRTQQKLLFLILTNFHKLFPDTFLWYHCTIRLILPVPVLGQAVTPDMYLATPAGKDCTERMHRMLGLTLCMATDITSHHTVCMATDITSHHNGWFGTSFKSVANIFIFRPFLKG